MISIALLALAVCGGGEKKDNTTIKTAKYLEALAWISFSCRYVKHTCGGARLIGGCCGTTPEDIRGIAVMRQGLLKSC